MGIRYLGSKVRVLEELAPLIGEPNAQSGRFIDAFSGTGVVASLAADLGWEIHVNDHLRCAKILSTARVLAVSDVCYPKLDGYHAAVDRLNRVSPVKGFLWREYSPSSAEGVSHSRKYFTEENAARLDGIRVQIRKWHLSSTISDVEEELLLADLIEAASSVANTAGTFGCFLSKWSSTALRPISVQPRKLRTKPVRYTASEVDVFSVPVEDNDIVYLDPPYTKRQYAAYYHILETIANGDEPEVSGVTGLRPWKSKASPFNYKRRALPAMLRLVEECRAKRVMISYSSDGHIDLEALSAGLKNSGSVKVHQMREIPRYQPRRMTSKKVSEFVVEFRRD